MLIDNDFLTEQEKQHAQSLLFSNDIFWSLNKETAVQDYSLFSAVTDQKTEEHFQFCHWLKHKQHNQSPYYDYFYNNIFLKFINKHNIEHSNVFRAKLNFVTSLQKDVYQSPHVDVKIPHKVFLYYINDSDGDTIFFNEKYNGVKQELTVNQAIAPEMGKGILFDGLTYHSPTAPKNSLFRAVLNVDFN